MELTKLLSCEFKPDDFASLGGTITVLDSDKDNDEEIQRVAEDRAEWELSPTHYLANKRYLSKGVLVTISYFRKR